MRTSIATAMALLLAACADSSLPPTPEGSRNLISAGVGVASVMTDCGDGVQRSTPGAGVGFMLTACPTTAPDPKKDISDGVGMLSIGVGLAITISDCGGFRLTGVGLGLGLVAAPCPGPRPTPRAK